MQSTNIERPRAKASPKIRRTLVKFRVIAASLVVILLARGLASAGDSPDKKREKTRKMAAQTLQDLYKIQPTSQAAIQKSAGYAVFNNMGTNLLVLSTARGAGVAVNSKTKKDTFMKMLSAGAGLGIGVKDYRVVFVFETEKALAQFLDSGWSGSGQADAAAKTSKSGGAYSGAVLVEPGVWVYQITKKGLALQVTLQGTKYYKDDDLNKSKVSAVDANAIGRISGR
jgi:lipid-binding SYLF domain-containing protein